MPPQNDIVVIGSVNSDILITQQRLPNRGETYLADASAEEFGGKGANQTVQCARLDHSVTFIAAVGEDVRGDQYRQHLESEGVTCRFLTSSQPTGLGIVHVVGDGEVYATVAPGANLDLSPEWVRANESDIQKAHFLILQNEMPSETVEAAIGLAEQHGVRIVYNVAPAREVSPALTSLCYCLVVNEEEAAFLLGWDSLDMERVCEALRELQRYCPRIILTAGSQGSYLAVENGLWHVPACATEAIDTTGAGDSFVGSYVCALNSGMDDIEAASMATKAAALTTTGVGAQVNMPRPKDLSHEAIRATPLNS